MDDGILVLPLHPRYELGWSDIEFAVANRLDQAARPFPKAQRTGQNARQFHFASQEHAIPWHEDIVEHHDTFPHSVLGACRIAKRSQESRVGKDRYRECKTWVSTDPHNKKKNQYIYN